MALVEHDGSELMARLRWHQELAAAVRESANERAEIVAEMRVIVAEMRRHADEAFERAAPRHARLAELMKRRGEQHHAAAERRRIAR
jgi:hypothetical protein